MTAPSIIYQDEYILVLNKPSGITVNRADTTKGVETLQDFVEKHWKLEDRRSKLVKETRNLKLENPVSSIHHQQPASNVQSPASKTYDPVKEFYDRGGIVHRLDKETSGVILVAKDPTSFAKLKKQFMEKTVQKTYVTLVHGKVDPEASEINVPIGRLEFNRKRFGVVAGGREAVTHYKVIQRLTFNALPLTLVELYPQTGRTHQIRVHMKHIGNPVFGDMLYTGRKVSRRDRKFLPRVFLHATKISFTHPKTGGRVEFSAPLPEELKKFLDLLSTNNH